VLGGALEARRGRGEHTAEGARRLSGKGWRSSSRLRRLGRMDGLDRERRSSTGEKGPWCLYQEITRDPPKITTGPRWVPW
jgi:hypothetical protein